MFYHLMVPSGKIIDNIGNSQEVIGGMLIPTLFFENNNNKRKTDKAWVIVYILVE